MSKVAFGIGLAIGAAIGSVVTYFVVDEKLNKKYNLMVQEEIIKVQEVYDKKLAEHNEKYDKLAKMGEEIQKHVEADRKFEHEEAAKRNQNKPDLMRYYDKVKSEGYTQYSENDDVRDHKDLYKEVLDPEREPMILDEGYIISPETYEDGVYDGFEQICMTYYADGVLCYDGGEKVEDEDLLSIVPDDFGVESYGIYDGYEDIVFTRNEFTHKDYEICRSNLTYEEVASRMPHDVEIRDEDN